MVLLHVNSPAETVKLHNQRCKLQRGRWNILYAISATGLATVNLEHPDNKRYAVDSPVPCDFYILTVNEHYRQEQWIMQKVDVESETGSSELELETIARQAGVNHACEFSILENNALPSAIRNDTTDVSCIGYTWRGSHTPDDESCLLWTKVKSIGIYQEPTPENEFRGYAAYGNAEIVNGHYVYRGWAPPRNDGTCVDVITGDINPVVEKQCSKVFTSQTVTEWDGDYNHPHDNLPGSAGKTSINGGSPSWVHYAGPGYVPKLNRLINPACENDEHMSNES